MCTVAGTSSPSRGSHSRALRYGVPWRDPCGNCTSLPACVASRYLCRLTMFCARIAARSIQGIGGSGLYSLSQVCLVEQGPGRPEIVGALVGITLSASYILGPLLGGAISAWTWRGIFWIKFVFSRGRPTRSDADPRAVSLSVCSLWWVSTRCGQTTGGTAMTRRQASPRSTSSEIYCL